MNNINCESTDIESDTENTISIKTINVENDYEPLLYDQPFHFHNNENHTRLLLNYYTRPKRKNKMIEQIKEKVTTLIEPVEKPVPCFSTNLFFYRNVPKEPPREKILTIPFLLECPKSKKIQPPDLAIDFLIDSGAESNIINIPTWIEIKILHPKLIPLQTAIRLATTQDSILTNYGKI